MNCKIVVQTHKNGVILSEGTLAECNYTPGVGTWFSDHGDDIGSIIQGVIGTFQGDPSSTGEAIVALSNCLSGSEKSAAARDSWPVIWDGTFDRLCLTFQAWSEDELKGSTCHAISLPAEAEYIYADMQEKYYVIQLVLNPALLDEGHYGFAFGAQDDGTVWDVAVMSVLDVDFHISPQWKELREQETRLRAYYIWEQKGRGDGHALSDWLQAEQELSA